MLVNKVSKQKFILKDKIKLFCYACVDDFATDKFERKINERGAVRTGKRLTLFISKKHMDDIIKIVKSLEDSGLLIDGDAETGAHETKNKKHKTKKQQGGFLGAMMAPMAASLMAPMASSLMQFVASSLISAISGKGVMRAGKGQEAGFPTL